MKLFGKLVGITDNSTSKDVYHRTIMKYRFICVTDCFLFNPLDHALGG